ncbi:MAG: hypothetical protein D6696_19120, partial [Acidobacteria bacterium]
MPMPAALLRPAVLAACAVLAWTAFDGYRSWQGNRDRLLALVADAGALSPAVERRLRREITPHHARLEAARALVFHLLAAPPLAELPAAEREAAGDARRRALDAARSLAREGLAAQPNSWQAAMLVGATTYLEWSLDRDPRLFTDADAWHQPLLAAVEAAPREAEPRRVLATAYLELWPVLSPARKDFARRLLRRTFAEDPESFARLGIAWLKIAGDPEEAFALVPDQPSAWLQVLSAFAAEKRFQLVCRSHERYLASLERSLARRLEDGERRLDLGDVFHSRTRFARVVAEAPPEQRFVPLVNRALARYPPGLLSAGTNDAMAGWLRWAIALSEVRLFPLEPNIVARLAVATQRLGPPDAALVALLGGDRVRAERLERLSREHAIRAWAPYLIAKAHYLVERGQAAAADEVLARVDPASRQQAPYWLARQAVARALGDPVLVAEADHEVDRRRAGSWPADAWRSVPRGWSLYVLPAAAGSGLTITPAEVAPEGAAVLVRWDGATAACRAIRPGRPLHLEIGVTPDPHLLEWSTVGGLPTRPGPVELLPAT